MDFGGGDEIAFEVRGGAGLVTLTRPKALNALTHGMVNALTRALAAWKTNPDVRHIVLLAEEGRAFCAGGDIMDIYRAGLAGDPYDAFFFDEYRLNAEIARYPKPYIALIDGIVMGGGVGISIHGSHRVMSEKTVFAMPEVGIGFFPDVGGSYFLPRIAGRYGLYLALTGERIRWGDALKAGLGTHGLASERFPDLLDRLTAGRDAETAIGEIATERQTAETHEQAFDVIRKCFSGQDLDTVMSQLEAASVDNEFIASALATIRKRSPTSVHVAFRQINEGAGLSMDECMQMEFRILNRMLRGHDFYEGIRAAVVDRSTPPQWRPADLADVAPEMIDAYFAPLGSDELPMP